MKILQISASYKPAYIYGGPTMSVSSLSEQLVKVKHSIMVFTTTANGKRELQVEANVPKDIDGITVTYFNRLTKDHTHYSPKLLAALTMQAKNFDVIHIHAWWNLVSILSCMISLAKGVKVVVSPRGTLSQYSFTHKSGFLKSIFHQTVGKRLLNRCAIHATSANELRELKDLIDPKQKFNIPNFIHFPHFEKRATVNGDNAIKLLFLSRIDEKKGLDILLNALALANIPWRLSIAGDGDPSYIEGLKRIAVEKKIDHYISWLGFRQSDKFDVYQHHDLFILPSHNENFGNVVLESLCVGTPVLISKQVGLADYIASENLGWVFDRDEMSLKNTILLAADDYKKRTFIQENAPGLIRSHFSEEVLIKRYEEMYQQIVAIA